MIVFLLIITIFLSLPGCRTKPSATGKDYEVVVITDREIWELMENEVRGVLERPIFGVHTEKAFEIVEKAREERRKVMFHERDFDPSQNGR